jgi:hypothetical protein
MSFRFDTVQEEDEWVFITADWWRTAFISVPWTYAPSDATKGKSPRRQFHGSLFAGLSQCPRRNTYSDDVLCKFSDDTLNPELVGVCGAMAAVVSYEEDVGFSYSTCPTIEPHELNLFTRVDLSISVDENDLLMGRQRWKELVDDLMNGEIFETDIGGSLKSSLTESFSSASDLTLSSMDFSSSDGSTDSSVMPSTPKAKHIFTDVEVKVSSPFGSIDGSGFDNPDFIPPGKSLNAAASSFVPTFSSQSYDAIHFPPLIDASKSSSPSLSFANFTFPTLNASSQPQPTVRLRKDEQGFFTEVQKEPGGEPVKLLPPFLQESSPHRNRLRKSRTREIVDRLRSTSSLDGSTTAQFPLSNGIELSQKYASHSPSPIPSDGSFVIPRLSVSEDGDRTSGLSTPSEDDDGWISQPNTVSPRHRAKRTRETRELFLALTRRRTDSLSSDNLKDLLDSSTYDDSSELPPRNTSTNMPSPPPQTPPPLASNDGWIESNPPLPKSQKKSKSSSKDSHRRKKSSTHNNSSSRASLSTPSTSSSHFPVVSSPSTSACFSSHPSQHHQQHQHHQHHQHQHLTISPHSMVQQPQPIPYFFPAVATPVPYTAFMHFPAFPISIPMHGHTGIPINALSNTPYGTSPALITRQAGSVMPTYRG